MKISAAEEYGLRCILQMALRDGDTMTLGEIAQAEGLSNAYVAKLMGILRKADLVTSIRGVQGGYKLARPADEINIAQVLVALGDNLFTLETCDKYSGDAHECVHLSDCTIRSLWSQVEGLIAEVLTRTSLKDLVTTEKNMNQLLQITVDKVAEEGPAPKLIKDIRRNEPAGAAADSRS